MYNYYVMSSMHRAYTLLFYYFINLVYIFNVCGGILLNYLHNYCILVLLYTVLHQQPTDKELLMKMKSVGYVVGPDRPPQTSSMVNPPKKIIPKRRNRPTASDFM